MIFFYILTTASAYILGSIPNSILICKLLHCSDPRHQGSHNPGATNVYRIAGIQAAIYVILLDSFKGIIPIWIGKFLQISPVHLGLIAISVCLGHMYSIFLQFQGGKGIATTFGILIMIDINLSIIIISIWIITVSYSKYVSLGSMISVIITPFYIWYFQPQYLFSIITISILTLFRHIDNIKRLWNHQEKKIW